MSFYTPKQWAAAGHTLWQAALASGGLATVVDAGFHAHPNISGVEQGGYVVAVAVAASGASLVKSAVVNWLDAHKASKAAQVVEDALKFAQATKAYQTALKPAETPAVPVAPQP